jgi:hypothetical protein
MWTGMRNGSEALLIYADLLTARTTQKLINRHLLPLLVDHMNVTKIDSIIPFFQREPRIFLFPQ